MSKKKRKKLNQGQVIIPTGHPNPPEQHEIEVAWILAQHFDTTVEFLLPIDDYKRKTQDIVLLGVEWEMKSPIGNSRRHTIKGQFDRANKQLTRNMVFDGRRTSLPDNFISNAIRRELGIRRRIKRVLFVTKNAEVIEIGK
jgi:hypothetical protein